MIRKIKYRDLQRYVRLRNNCFYANPSSATPARFLLADRVLFIANKALGYFLPLFENRFNVFGYYLEDKLIGFHHLNQRHLLWPYRIRNGEKQIYSELAAVEHQHRGKGILKTFFRFIFHTYNSYDVFDIVRKDNIACLSSTRSMKWKVYDEVTRYGFDLRHADYDPIEKHGGLIMHRKSPDKWKHAYDLYVRSLSQGVAELERPKPEYFQVSWRYRFNLFLLFLFRLYDEEMYVWAEEGTDVIEMFAYIRNNLLTKEIELLLIADPHVSSEDVSSVRKLLAHLTKKGQQRVISHVRSNHRNVHDALKILGFTPEGEYICRVHKGQENVEDT